MFKKDDSPVGRLHGRAKAQIGMLSLTFLFGMAINLVGFGEDVKGAASVVSTISLMFHGLLGLSLLIGAIIGVFAAKKAGPEWHTIAWSGLVVIIATFTAGVLTMATDNNWFSYLMAVGFLVSLLLYGVILTRTAHKL